MYLPYYTHLIKFFIYAVNRYLFHFLYVQDTKRVAKISHTDMPFKNFIVKSEK